MIFMVFMTTWGMVANFRNYVAAGNTLLAVIDGIIIVLEVWMIVEAINVLGRVRQGRLGQPNVKA